MATDESNFICWLALWNGTVRRVEVVSTNNADALQLAMHGCPGAVTGSCRRVIEAVFEETRDV